MVLTQDTGRAVTAALSAAGLPGSKVEAVLHAMDVPAKGIVEPFEHAEVLLETARHLGLRCVVISNATYRTGRAYRRDFDSFSLGSLIDGIVSSVDIGYRKPHELLFLAAAAEAETAPNN
ncbi:MAG: HAD family hydrolase [Actinomycetota bacterium]